MCNSPKYPIRTMHMCHPFPQTETIMSGVSRCTSPNVGATYICLWNLMAITYHTTLNVAEQWDICIILDHACAFIMPLQEPTPCTIDRSHVDRLSITYKVQNEHERIWSLAGDYRDQGDGCTHNCMSTCWYRSNYNPPFFVRHDYYYESGAHTSNSAKWYMDNPLWDGKGCHSSSRCCDNKCQPWFWCNLPKSVNSDIEVRWMRPTASSSNNFGISLLEIHYVR